MTDPQDAIGAVDDAAGFLALVRSQGGAEAAETIAAAEQTAQRLREEAARESKAIRDAAINEGRERGRRMQAKILAETEAMLQRERLFAREQLLQATLESARQRLREVCAAPGATQCVGRLIREAVEPLPAGPVKLFLPAEYLTLLDAKRIADDVGDRWQIEISTQDAPASGGVIACSADGRLRYDNSFAERLRRMEDAARFVAYAVLLGEGHELL